MFWANYVVIEACAKRSKYVYRTENLHLDARYHGNRIYVVLNHIMYICTYVHMHVHLHHPHTFLDDGARPS